MDEGEWVDYDEKVLLEHLCEYASPDQFTVCITRRCLEHRRTVEQSIIKIGYRTCKIQGVHVTSTRFPV